LSDNQIPPTVLETLLFVFGIKNQELEVERREVKARIDSKGENDFSLQKVIPIKEHKEIKTYQ